MFCQFKIKLYLDEMFVYFHWLNAMFFLNKVGSELTG